MKKYKNFDWTMDNIELEIRHAISECDLETLTEIINRWLPIIPSKKKRLVFWDICAERYTYIKLLEIHGITDGRCNQIVFDCLGMLLAELPKIYKNNIGSLGEKHTRG